MAEQETPKKAAAKESKSSNPVDSNPTDGAGDELPDTPSGQALKEVGNLDGEDAVEAGMATEDVLEHGEKYQAAKSKARWGY